MINAIWGDLVIVPWATFNSFCSHTTTRTWQKKFTSLTPSFDIWEIRDCVSVALSVVGHNTEVSTTDRPRKGKKFRNCQGVKNFSTHSLLLLLRCLRFTYLFNPRIRVARIVLLYNRMWSLVCTQSWWDSPKLKAQQQRHSPYPDQLDCVQWCPFAVTLAEVTGWIAVLCIVSLWSLSTVDDGGGVNRLTLLINNHDQFDSQTNVSIVYDRF